MIESSGDITQYIYDENDQLSRVNLPNFYFEDYSYDTRGNLTGTQLYSDGVIDTPVGNPTLFEYNARNQLTRIELPTTQRIDYEYDYRGNRVRQEEVGSQDPTNYLWDEFSRFGDVILETGVNFTDGTLYHKMNYTLVGGQLISQTDDADLTRYFLSDAQGTTRALTDSTGLVTSEFSYNAFGELDDGIDPLLTETNYLYTGQQFDGYSELYSMRARYYDPTQGRFMTRDTYAYNYSNPFELNRYAYGANNPVTFSDPSGHSIIGRAITGAKNVLEIAKTRPIIGGLVGGSIGALTGALHAATIYRGINHGMCGSMELPDRTSFILGATLIGAGIGAAIGAGLPAAAAYSPTAAPYVKIALGIVGSAIGAYGIYDSGRQFAGDLNNHGAVNLCAALNGGLSVLAVYGSLQMLGDGLVEGPVGQWMDDVIRDAFKGTLDDGVAGTVADDVAQANIADDIHAIPRFGNLQSDVMEVPISELRPVHDVPRRGVSPQHIDDIASNIQSSGYDVSQPAGAVRMPSGDLVITDGHHRIAAMRSLNEATIPTRIVNYTDADPVRLAYILEIGETTGLYSSSYRPILTSAQLRTVNRFIRLWRASNDY